MAAIAFLGLGLLLAWVARDLWKLKGGAKLPTATFFSIFWRKPPSHLSLNEQSERQEYFERNSIGNPDQLALVFGISSIGCFLAAAYLALGP
jgi:hypothetical protein